MTHNMNRVPETRAANNRSGLIRAGMLPTTTVQRAGVVPLAAHQSATPAKNSQGIPITPTQAHPKTVNTSDVVAAAREKEKSLALGEHLTEGLYQAVFNDDPLFGKDSVFSGEGAGT